MTCSCCSDVRVFNATTEQVCYLWLMLVAAAAREEQLRAKREAERLQREEARQQRLGQKKARKLLLQQQRGQEPKAGMRNATQTSAATAVAPPTRGVRRRQRQRPGQQQGAAAARAAVVSGESKTAAAQWPKWVDLLQSEWKLSEWRGQQLPPAPVEAERMAWLQSELHSSTLARREGLCGNAPFGRFLKWCVAYVLVQLCTPCC